MVKRISIIFFGFFIFLIGFLVRKYNLVIPYNLKHVEKETKEKNLFTDISDSISLNYFYHPPRINPMAYYRIDTLVQGPGVAVVDINNDGFLDFFIPSPEPDYPSTLYINQGNHTFSEEADKYGLKNLSTSNFKPLMAIFFDTNNNGIKELYLAGIGCSRFFYFSKKQNKYVENLDSGLTDCESSQGATFFDYNNDGLLDLYINAYWGEKDLTHTKSPYVYVNSLYNATNGGKNRLYKNLGNYKFQDVTEKEKVGDTHWTYDSGFSDINGDGLMELYLANDYGPDKVFQVRDNHFYDITDSLKNNDRRYGMNVSFIDMGKSNPSIYISNQFVGEDYSLLGNFFWSYKGNNLHDDAKTNNLHNCLMAWGAGHGDFNLDGYEDIYITNGFSAKRKHWHPEHINKPYHRDIVWKSEKNSFYHDFISSTLPSTLTTDIRNWKKHIYYGSRNNQKDCLFINQNNNYFINQSHLNGNIKVWNGKSVATIDTKNNGILDLIVTTNNGPAHFFKNQTSLANKNWIGFKIFGSSSNKQSVGAKVEVKQGSNLYTRWITGGRNGFLSISDERAHIGLPTSKNIKVKITWPSGKFIVLDTPKLNRYHKIYEP